MAFAPIPPENIHNAKISIIIPTLNEAGNIATTLSSAILTDQNIEIILVDGGSQDQTLEISQKYPVQIITSPPGRAQQMNAGAKNATGDILLFLHADTQLPPEYATIVRSTLAKNNIIAGAFSLKIAAPQPALRLIEWGVKMRSQYLQLPYGDQGIFLTRNLFLQVGMFPILPIMEDFQFVRSLQRFGKIALVSEPVTTSPRRWLSTGILKTTFINQIIIMGFFLGIPPHFLRRLYRGMKG